ncbi:MAG: exodeoxyribonuclease III [Nitrospirota bacterium]|nr:exodeoxyribonuclease III [Nitrospirota bacterium]
MTPFTVATWNVNSLRSRLDHVLAFLRDHCPDVLCLQELKCTVDDLPRDAFESLGYHIAAHGQKTYNGVAIISPYPLGAVQSGFASAAGETEPLNTEARLVAASVLGIRVVNVYVPNGSELESDKYRYKLAWMERLRVELQNRHNPSEPLLLCGDFNVAMDDRDVYDPAEWKSQVLCSDAERAAARAWREWGLEDALAKHHPQGGIYSWWDYRGGMFPGDKGLRIDHIWVTRPLLARCTGCEVVRGPRGLEKPSDHAPVVAEFSGVDPAG